MKKRSWLKATPLVFFVLFALCMHATFMSRFEGWAYQSAVARMNPVLTAVLKGITHLGDTVSVFLFCMLLFAFKRSRKTIAAPMAAAVLIATMIGTLLKAFFARQRPDILRLISETNYSFPSGHATISAALFTLLILFAFWFLRNRLLKTLIALLCAFMIVSIGFSRIYLGVHFANDVIAGWLVGFAVAVHVYYFWSGRRIQIEPELQEPDITTDLT